MDWFDGSRFGLFVHWGHSSQRGIELSWPLVGGVGALPLSDALPAEDYHATAPSFDPKPNAARDWLARAKRAGMRYAVLTTKHHDGFALWPTRAPGGFSVLDSRYGGDLVREFVDATRAAGLRVGFYFSLLDWHHPDYPPFRDEHRPYRFGRAPRPSSAQWERFLEFQFAQLRELLTQYGVVDLLWFDGGWERTPEEWRAREFAALARELQPDILLNDRLPGEGDFDTPEQFIPPKPPARRWETCMTMNESWGWSPRDAHYKSPRALVHALCEVASRGGNLLLNASPMSDGALPAEQIERLDALARWMDAHAASIHDTTPGLEPWQFYGPSTRRGDRVYLHLLMRLYDAVTVRGVPIRRVRAARVLASGRALEFDKRCSVLDRMFNPDPLGEISIRVPESELDPLATVLELEISPPAAPASA